MSIVTIQSPFIEAGVPKWASGYGQDRYGYFAEFSIPTGPEYWQFVTQRMRWIPPGTFMMGSPWEEPGREKDERLHEVTLTEGFWLADTACTQALWQAITGTNPSRFQKDEERSGELPVERVSFEDVRGFLAKLRERLGAESSFTLPTEAQWEYACRAGTRTPFSFGETISTNQANFDGNFPYAGQPKSEYRKETVPVKAFSRNRWGLYQMHGNVWEWCQDWYGAYPDHAVTDPAGPETGADRVVRGGGWIDGARDVRSAYRNGHDPGSRDDALGFRLLSSASQDRAPERVSGSRRLPRDEADGNQRTT